MFSKNLSQRKILLLIILFALLVRLPWLYTTIERDEATNALTAWRVLHGETLYKDIHADKPPLLYVFYLVPISIFGNSIIPIRLLNNLLFVFSIIIFFRIAENIFKRRVAIYSTILFAFAMNIPVFEGQLAMSESLLTLFVLLSVYSYYKFAKEHKPVNLFLSSLFMTLSVLTKHQAIILWFMLLTLFLIHTKSAGFIKKNRPLFLKSLLYLILPMGFVTFATLILMVFMEFDGILIIIKLSAIRAISTVTDLFKAIFGLRQIGEAKAVVTLSMWRSYKYVPFGYVLLYLLEGAFLFFLSLVGMFKLFKEKSRPKCNFSKQLVIVWFSFSLMVSLVPKAFGHFFIFLIPPASLLAGFALYNIIKKKSVRNNLFLVLVLVLLMVSLFFQVKHYPDFHITYGPYRMGFSDFGSYSDQLAFGKFIKETKSKDDSIIVFGWAPVIYWLSETKPITQSSFNFNADDLFQAIQEKQPRYIIIMPYSDIDHLSIFPVRGLTTEKKKEFEEYLEHYILSNVEGIRVYSKKE